MQLQMPDEVTQHYNGIHAQLILTHVVSKARLGAGIQIYIEQ